MGRKKQKQGAKSAREGEMGGKKDHGKELEK